MTSFEYPPFFSLPPFFTIQPNNDTRTKQLEMWATLICDYCRANRLFTLDISDASKSVLWKNATINRSLNSEALKVIANYLVEQGYARYDTSKTQLTISWKREREWADLIYSWVKENGKTGSVETFFALTEGEEVEKEEFYQLPKNVLIHALELLEREEKAQIFKADNDAQGVKFF